MNYIIKTAPTVEPILLAEAQAHCRSIDDTAENSTLTALIIAAREYCELYTRKALAPQTIELYFDYFPTDIYLPLPPVTSVTSIIYTDYLGVATTITATDYIVDAINNRIVLAYDKTWPTFTPYATNPIKITYVTGYTSATIPKAIKQAMLLLIGHWYINREATGTADKPIEFSVRNLLSLHRAGWF